MLIEWVHRNQVEADAGQIVLFCSVHKSVLIFSCPRLFPPLFPLTCLGVLFECVHDIAGVESHVGAVTFVFLEDEKYGLLD